MLAPDAIWITPQIANLGGTFHGPQGVAGFFQQIAATWDFQGFEPRQYIASGDQVVVCGSYTVTSRATGRQASSDWAMVWTIRDGKLVHFQEFADTAALRDALAAAASA